MIRLAIRCRADQAELALAQLMELAPAGVEEVRDGDIVEYAVYGPPGEIPELPDLRAAVGDSLVEVTTTEVADDWHERWRQFHGPVLIGDERRGYVLLRPSWETSGGDAVRDESSDGSRAGGASAGDGDQSPARQPSAVGPSRAGVAVPPDVAPPRVGPQNVAPPTAMLLAELELDPGQAFGTGSHPTTRLCVDLLLDLVPEVAGGARREVVDLGCGSGVLAIVAGKLGFGPLRCYDFDPLSVEATAENAQRNGVQLSVERCDIREGLPPAAPVVLANLLRPLLLEVAAKLAPPAAESGSAESASADSASASTGVGVPATAAGVAGPDADVIDTAILSGLLDEEADEIAHAFSELGLAERRRVSEGGWTALLLTRPGPSRADG